MADFAEQSNTKVTIRELIAPIADIATFNTLVSGVVSGNPWSCTAYEAGGIVQPAVETSREVYTAKVLSEDEAAKTVWTAQAKCPFRCGIQHRNREHAREYRPRDGNGRRRGPQLGERDLFHLPEDREV